MPDEERKEKRRVGEGWENYSTISDRYSTGVPILRPLKPINPREETERFVGKDASGRPGPMAIAPLIKSKMMLILAYSVITVLGIASTLIGVYSLVQALMFGSPYPQTNADLLILGSFELIIFGVLFSVAFGVLVFKNSKEMKALRRMMASSNKGAGSI